MREGGAEASALPFLFFIHRWRSIISPNQTFPPQLNYGLDPLKFPVTPLASWHRRHGCSSVLRRSGFSLPPSAEHAKPRPPLRGDRRNRGIKACRLARDCRSGTIARNTSSCRAPMRRSACHQWSHLLFQLLHIDW